MFNRENVKGKKITIMGLGLNQGGLGITRFLAESKANLIVTDLKKEAELKPTINELKKYHIKYILGKHREEDFINTDLVIQNPAIPNNSRYLQIARNHGIPIKTDLDIFLNFCPTRRIIAIGGTKGKSTVSNLVYEIFQKAKIESILAGNMGISVFNVLDKIRPSTYLILEISSWQLEGIKDHHFRAKTSVLTNILPDHLDRYSSYKKYAQAEKLIYRYLKKDDQLILNHDNPETFKEKKNVPAQIQWFSTKKTLSKGCYIDKNNLIYSSGKNNTSFAKLSDLYLSGRHDLENILAACTVSFIHKIPAEVIMQVITKFSGIPYRMELVREKNGVKYYNDTCATTPEATIAALHSLSGKSILLVAGGKNKKLKYNQLIQTILQEKRIKKIILFQHNAYDVSNLLFSELQKLVANERIVLVKNMSEAVRSAHQEACPGDTVLLSPAAASFGLFINEFDRGNQFNQEVNLL